MGGQISNQLSQSQPKDDRMIHDRYDFGKKLGEGSYGKVYLATEKPIKKRFTWSNKQPNPILQTRAVKVCDKTKLGKEDLLALQQEISILHSLGGHEHIIQLYDVYHDPDKCYLVMEYMAGGELLESVIALKKYSEKKAMLACAQILKALQFCHERKIAHRDIKLENILLTHSVDKEGGVDNIHPSWIKVGDFGFAITPAESHSGLKTRLGSPSYVAPEILLGKSYGYAVDMWSVGVLVYILLCGYPPFRSKDPEQVKRFIRRCRFEFHDEYWGKVSEEAKDFISSLLTLDPSQRLTASAARNHPWFNILSPQDPDDIFDEFVLDRLRLLNAKTKLRTAVFTVVAVNKFTSLGIHHHFMMSRMEECRIHDRYDFGKKLGEGSYGMVYLVTEKTIKKQFTGSNTQPYPFPQTCAVKVCDKTKLGKEDLLALQQEITILQSLGGHDHIVHLYNVYNDPDKCYLVMEYMAGGALVDSLIKLKTYSERDAMHACAQILKALQFCHERKIAHRDIKLQNILLAHTVYKELGLDNIHPSCIKVCDFGFAITPAESHSGLKTSCGTLEYVAPEILLGKSYGYAVDMWSVGVLVYTLLCGYLPFRSKDPEQLKRFIRRCRFEFHDEYWGKVSEEAKDFISSLLTLDPSKRLSASAARKHPWFNRLLVSDVIFHTLDQDRLRLFNIKSKLRTAVFTVVAVNKFTSLGIHFHSMLIGIV